MESSGFDFFSMTMRAFIGDNSRESANGVAVDWVIDRKISHVGIVHCPNESLERGKIFGGVAVHFDIGDMPRVADCVIGSLDFNLVARADWEINGHVA